MAFPGSYLDFVLATRDVKLTKPDDVINEAMQNSYILTEMLRGKDAESITKGGSALVDFIQTATNGSFQTYRPGDNLTPVSADATKKISLAWRFMQCNYSWLDEEVVLNTDDPAAFFDIKRRYEAMAVTDFVQGIENKLWAVPSNTDMEDASNGKEPYSIPCFVNEHTNTLPSGFTTVMTLSPSTTTVWQNQKAGYTAANIANLTSTTGLMQALDTCLEKVEFEPVPFGPAKQFQEPSNLSKMMIATTLNGRNVYKSLLRSGNDRTVRPQDAAYGSVTFSGYPLKRVNALETAAIYTGVGVAGSHTSGVANDGYPRFYFLNLNYLYPIFNRDKFFDPLAPIKGGPNKPNFNVQYYMTMGQLWCGSRKRQGIVYPSA
jgi:hypothetical protein